MTLQRPSPLLVFSLDATSCGLDRVPPAFSQLTRLKQLELNRNKLTAGWDHVPRSLTYLALKRCSLPALPEALHPLAASGARIRITND